MKKIILFGASGQLGQDLQEVFSECETYKTISLSSKEFNLLSDKPLSPFLENLLPFDYLVNAMAFTNTGACENNIPDAYKLNSERVSEMASFCQKNNSTMFHISTDYVFDGQVDKPLQEIDQTNPLSVYGKSKLKGEELALKNLKKIFILRTSSLYGVKSLHGNFVSTMIKKSKELEKLTVVNDQFMSPTHTFDIARTVKHFIDQNIIDYGIFNCSGEGRCSWLEFAQEIMKLIENSIEIEGVSYKSFPSKLERPIYSELDNNKLSQYYKMPYWKDSLKEYLQKLGVIA